MKQKRMDFICLVIVKIFIVELVHGTWSDQVVRVQLHLTNPQAADDELSVQVKIGFILISYK